MMMRMLNVGGLPVLADGVREADDDNPRGYYEFEIVKKTREDSTWLKDAGGKAVKMVYRLMYDLPKNYHYRAVLMRREMSEILASQSTMLRRQGRDKEPVSDEEIDILFDQQLRDFEGWIAAQPHILVLTVSYNEVLRDPGPPVDAVNEFLGGGLDTAAMRAVVEPALYRNRLSD